MIMNIIFPWFNRFIFLHRCTLRYFYTVLFYFFLPLVFLRLLWRSRKVPGYKKHWCERLGFFPYQVDQSIWVHAVSVGEAIAAIPLVKSLQKNYPEMTIVMTGMTPTGRERVNAAFGDSVKYAYLPYDLPSAIKRFIHRAHPKLLIVMETELWPNLFATCLQLNIPILVANARLSQKSADGYNREWLKSIRNGMFTAISRLAAQADYDAERFVALGLAREKIEVTGNLKFDLEIPQDLLQKKDILKQSLGSDRPIWIAASTHNGEEEIILQAAHKIREKNPAALLILVPRHPDRFDGVAKLIAEQGFNLARRSKGDVCNNETHVYLADTMGEMLLMYSVADVTYVGGSMVKVGGHNMLEPAALHKAILSGPILYNFTEISQLLLTAKGMLIVNNHQELANAVLELLSDADYRTTLAENAYSVVAANKGSLEKQLGMIRSILNS